MLGIVTGSEAKLAKVSTRIRELHVSLAELGTQMFASEGERAGDASRSGVKIPAPSASLFC